MCAGRAVSSLSGSVSLDRTIRPGRGQRKIYVASGEGTIAVLAPGDELRVMARNDLDKPIYATPAIVAGTLYVRTAGHLYAFR
ncbi:MAG: PQQ-binding-like beta-propeller repeat protein [Luteitalea sp.]|nr:PQQ-binding-like beta-propeller repeat protein [Luteitalea sp.]